MPARYAAHRHLRVEVSTAELAIFHDADKIAVHRLCHGKHHRVIDPKHLEGLVPKATITPLQVKLRQLRALGPAAATFIDGLVKTQTRFLPWHVGQLREALFKYGDGMLQQAMARASNFQAFDARTVLNLCRKMRLREQGGDPVPIGQVLTSLMAKLHLGDVQDRQLQDYETTTVTEG